jgi:hypothetical protein
VQILSLGGEVMPLALDLIGYSFERLTVIKKIGKNNFGKITWLCRCKCGNEKVIVGNSLVSGRTKSCGCLNVETIRTHNKSNTPEYITWVTMKDRCSNINSITYTKYYISKGITVCDEWKNSFETFLKDMGPKPFPKAELDRIDNNGNYEQRKFNKHKKYLIC